MPDLSRLRPVVPPAALSLLAPAASAARVERGRTSTGTGDVLRYRVHTAAAGAVVLVPQGEHVLRRQVEHGRRRGARALAVRALRAAAPATWVTVTGPAATVPAVVAAAAPDRPEARSCLVVGGGGPRRRAALLVAPRSGAAADRVVKAAPAEGADERASHEQQVLSRLARLRPGLGPEPLGAGTAGRWAWSAETLVPGRPLSETATDLSGAGRSLTAAVLGGLAESLGSLAAASRTPVQWSGEAQGVRLRGRHLALAPLVAQLEGVPAVLVHGDLATAHNVLVDGSTGRLIDWETASPAGLPLLDLLPLLCLLTARSAGHAGVDAQAAHVLELCAGRAPGSRWLLSLVAAHCRSAGVPLAAAGSVAALAWGHVASMPQVHAELARADGTEVAVWPTAADAVAAAWASHPDLGTGWPALAGVTGR